VEKKLIRELDDPTIDNKKINSKENFELVYIRHKYFRKSTNPTNERLRQFEEMICNISDKIYMRNIMVFKTVGFEKDDLRNIARIHTISFISMSGLAENPKLMEEFVKKHKSIFGKDSEPSKYDIFKREAYNLSRFLNQRIQEVARFSKGKNEGIRGTKNYRRFYAGRTDKNPSDLELFSNHEAYGYKKITEQEYKNIANNNDSKGKVEFTTSNGVKVRAVYIKGSFLKKEDIEGTYIDQTRGNFYRSPEESLLIKEAVYKNNNKKLYKKNR